MGPPVKPGDVSIEIMIYFEDISVGDKEELPGRLISKEEILDFAEQFDPQPHHLDEEAAKQSLLGGLSASGWHTCCALIRMTHESRSDEIAFAGSPGIEETRWKAPVRPGDTLRATSRVTEARASESKPAMGLIKRHYDVFNQDDKLVMTMDAWVMILRRPEAVNGSETGGAA